MSAPMIDPPRILDVPARPLAIVRLTIPRAEIRQVMGPGISEIYAALGAQGVAPAGRWLTHHLRMAPDIFDFEIAVPVPTPITPVGRVTNGTLPAARVAQTLYRGGYEGLGEAWGRFTAWIAAEGLTPAEDLWETYLTDPATVTDPGKYQTELTRPLVV